MVAPEVPVAGSFGGGPARIPPVCIRTLVWCLSLAGAMSLCACASAPPPVDLRAELAPRRPAWRPQPVGEQIDGRLVLGGVAGPSVAGVAAAGECGATPTGDLWLFGGDPEVALTIGWGDAPAALIHAPRPGCLHGVALLPGGIPEGVPATFERREVFDTCATGFDPAPTFTANTGKLDVGFGPVGVTVAGLGIPATYAAQVAWDATMCGSGTVAVELFETARGTFVRFSLELHQEGVVANRDVVETTQLRLTSAGPVVLSRSWSLSTAWGEEGESETVDTGEASLGWLWGDTAILRTEGWRTERRTDEDCETGSLAEYGNWTLQGVVLDQYDELETSESPECSE